MVEKILPEAGLELGTARSAGQLLTCSPFSVSQIIIHISKYWYVLFSLFLCIQGEY